jgi:hypothetical protein
MAVRLLRTALRMPRLTETIAIAVLEYYLQRNRVAKRSHHKAWWKKHKNIRFKVLL